MDIINKIKTIKNYIEEDIKFIVSDEGKMYYKIYNDKLIEKIRFYEIVLNSNKVSVEIAKKNKENEEVLRELCKLSNKIEIYINSGKQFFG